VTFAGYTNFKHSAPGRCRSRRAPRSR
jgi:hypothetical protein